MMATRIYLRPTAFVDAPFGLDGSVARLAGGMTWFAAVEIARMEGDRVASLDLVPVTEIVARLDQLGERALTIWNNLVAPRVPLMLGARTIRLDQPQVAGILNVTPDSFSDGGITDRDPTAAADAGHAMAAAGAALIDVGGESTRPGAKPVWEGDEVERVLPVVRRLAGAGTAISIDTRKAAVMEAALGAGAALVNDVSARSIAAATAAGIDRKRIIVDPGIGFGKTVQHNLQLLNGLALLHGLGCPVMLGASRKRMIGALSGEAPADRRLPGSIALALKGAEQGAQLLRVHDVPETVQALRVWRGLRDAALTPG
jgi:dihydropteroate synthase